MTDGRKEKAPIKNKCVPNLGLGSSLPSAESEKKYTILLSSLHKKENKNVYV